MLETAMLLVHIQNCPLLQTQIVLIMGNTLYMFSCIIPKYQISTFGECVMSECSVLNPGVWVADGFHKPFPGLGI